MVGVNKVHAFASMVGLKIQTVSVLSNAASIMENSVRHLHGKQAHGARVKRHRQDLGLIVLVFADA